MRIITQYIKEILHLKWYIISILASILLCYSVYLFFEEEIIAEMGREDKLFEWLTAISFLSTSICFFIVFLRRRNFFYLLFFLIFFAGFGEEISWGQRLFGFETPEVFENINVQKEFNIHNLELFNTEDPEGNTKQGLERLLEVNFMFKVFTILFGLILPIAVYHLHSINKLAEKIRLPVPPVTVGVFFVINWVVFRTLSSFVLPEGNQFQYYDTITEIYEFISAFIMLVISIYFLVKWKSVIPGRDIKQVI